MNLSLATYTVADRVATIAIHRPDKRGALSRQLIVDLTTASTAARDDASVRSVILTGTGPAFCAGMDLDELRGTLTDTADQVWADAHKLSALYQLIYTMPKPTVAAVNGTAVAGGAGLVTVCDLAVTVPTAKFGYPEVKRGLVAAMVMPHLLRHVTERMARYLLLTGDLIDAETAKVSGLVNSVVEADVLMPTALAWCKSFAEGGPKALAKTKELLAQCSRQGPGVDDLAKASAEPRLTDECSGGLTAFFDKKPLPWA